MKRFFYTGLLFILFSGFFAQEHDLRFDRYNAILRIKDDSTRCARLITYAGELRDSLHDYNLAQLIFSRAEAIVSKNHFPFLDYRVTEGRAYCAFLQGEFEKADQWYVKALQSPVLEGKDMAKADLLNRAGANLQNIGVFKRALQYYDQSLEIYTKRNDEQGKTTIYINMANVFVAMGDAKRADELYTSAAQIFLKNNLRDNYATVLGNQAVAKLSLGDPLEAKRLILRSYQYVSKKPKNIDQPVVLRFNTGLMYGENAQWDSSFFYLEEGRKLADSLGLMEQFAGTYNYNAGWAYEKMGNITRAISYYKKALDQRAVLADVADEGVEQDAATGPGGIDHQLHRQRRAVAHWAVRIDDGGVAEHAGLRRFDVHGVVRRRVVARSSARATRRSCGGSPGRCARPTRPGP